MWRWDQQEPFGVNVPDENPSGLGVFDLPLRLPGQYFDKETNLHYNYFRDYDPSIGRYEQSDPIGLQGGLNTYAYVANSPLSAVDPRGLRALAVPENCPVAPDGYKFERYEIVPIRKLDCKIIFDQKGRPKIHCDEMNELFGCRKTCYYVKTFCGIVYSRVTITVKCEVVDAEGI